MRKLLKRIEFLARQFLRNHFAARCEFCRGLLRKNGDKYYGGIDIEDTIGGDKKRTAYVCNLCYHFFKKLK